MLPLFTTHLATPVTETRLPRLGYQDSVTETRLPIFVVTTEADAGVHGAALVQ